MIKIDLSRNELEKPVQPSFPLLRGIKLPPSVEKFKKNISVGAFVVVGLSLFLAWVPHLFVAQFIASENTKHQVQVKALQQKRNAVSQEISRYSAFQTELNSYNEQKRLLSERISIVKQLLNARTTAVNVLDTLGQSLPRQAWLRSIEFVVAGLSPVIKLTGSAYSNSEISDYLDKLEESTSLRPWQFSLDEVTSATGPSGVELKNFTLTAKSRSQSAGSLAPDGSVTNNSSQTPSGNPTASSPPTGKEKAVGGVERQSVAGDI